MNSNQRPTKITASEFVAGNYAGKIARGECVVTHLLPMELFTVHDVYEGKPHKVTGSNLYIEYMDMDDPAEACNIRDSEQLTVSWLPQPATSEPDASAPKYAPLLPQTVNTIRYGTPEFEQLSRDDAEAEIVRLQAEVERLRVFVARVASRNYGSQSPMGFWITISQDARHLLSNDVERPVKEIFPVGFENDEERILYEPPSPKASTNSDAALEGTASEPDHR